MIVGFVVLKNGKPVQMGITEDISIFSDPFPIFTSPSDAKEAAIQHQGLFSDDFSGLAIASVTVTIGDPQIVEFTPEDSDEEE